MDKQSEPPIPKPRQLTLKKLQYENVSIETLNKNRNNNEVEKILKDSDNNTSLEYRPIPSPRKPQEQILTKSADTENISNNNNLHQYENCTANGISPSLVQDIHNIKIENNLELHSNASIAKKESNLISKSKLCHFPELLEEFPKLAENDNYAVSTKINSNTVCETSKSVDPVYGKLKAVVKPPRKNIKKNDNESLNLPSTSFFCTNGDNEYGKIFVDKRKNNEICSLEPLKIEVKNITNDSASTSRASTPEPVYMNQELPVSAEYSNIFNRKYEVEKDDPSKQVLNAMNPPARDVLYEFDPLMRQRHSTSNEISNQLLLLENLLQEDNYNNIFGGTHFSLIRNEELSDEDNAIGEDYLPPPPVRVDSLEPSEIIQEKNKITDVDESIIQTYLAKVDDFSNKDIDLTHPKKSQSNWYLGQSTESNKKVEKKKQNVIDPHDIPPPPYSESIASSSQQNIMETSTESLTSSGLGKSIFTNLLCKIDALKRKASFKNSRASSSDVNVIVEVIPKPKLTSSIVRHDGFLIRFPSGAIEDIFKELQNRKALLRDRKFLAYQESELKNLKETIPLDEITTIQCVSNSKVTENSTHYYCFEITTTVQKNQTTHQKLLNPNSVLTNAGSVNYRVQRIAHLYGIGKESERDIWMQKLLESLTDVFPSQHTCQYYRAGWCYLKKSISSQWSGSWILLKKKKRRLIIYIESEMNIEKIDLRKARCIVMKEADNSLDNLHVETGPILMIDCPPYSMYMIMSCPRETKIWKHIIREVSYNNGPALDEQQLTKYNIPVIIDKCINFIYIHGSMSEGIYRKSGSENAIQKLIYQFRSNAFNVEITKSEYTEHDIANVLKRFMRNLPQRLLGKYSESFISISQIEKNVDKLVPYKELLIRLSTIEYGTLKKLISHLAFIESQANQNKMTLENIAVIWGPTLLQTRSTNDDMEYNQKEANVITDLISLSKKLFPLTKEESVKEQAMLQYLKKYYAAAESLSDITIKQSGDLKVWIGIKFDSETSNEEQQNLCVILNPAKTAKDICKEIADKINKQSNELLLYEIIFNNSLERPLHNDNKVFETVLRWSYWPEEERKNNCLIIKSSKYLEQMKRTLKLVKNSSISKNLQFADNKTKSLKVLGIELKNKKCLIQKSIKNGKTLVKEFNLKNTTIYLGSERKLQYNWALTLIENDRNLTFKNRETNFIGHVIAGSNRDDQIVLFSNIWNNLYGDIIVP